MLTRLHRSWTSDPHELSRQAAWLLLVVVTAVALGFFIAAERWPYLAAVMGGTLLLAWPVEIALGLYAFLIPLEFLMTFGQERTTLSWYVGGLAILVLLTIGVLRNSLVRPSRTAIFLVLLIAWGGVTSLWAIDAQHALSRLPTALGLLALYLVVVCVRLQERELSRIILATIAGGCVAATYAGYFFLHGSGFKGRATLVLGTREADPNFFAASLLVPLALAFGEYLGTHKRSRKLLMASAAGLLGLGIFLSMSRGALLAVGVMLVVYFCRLQWNWRILIPIALLSAGLLVVPSLFFQRIEQSSETGGAGRLYVWQVGLAILQDKALLGAGLENFPDVYSRYAGKGSVYRGTARNAHNIYLLIAVETGILGIFLLLAAIVSQFRVFRRVRAGEDRLPPPRWVALEAGLSGILASAFFIDLIWYKSFWWAFILVGIAINIWSARSPRNQWVTWAHSHHARARVGSR